MLQRNTSIEAWKKLGAMELENESEETLLKRLQERYNFMPKEVLSEYVKILMEGYKQKVPEMMDLLLQRDEENKKTDLKKKKSRILIRPEEMGKEPTSNKVRLIQEDQKIRVDNDNTEESKQSGQGKQSIIYPIKLIVSDSPIKPYDLREQGDKIINEEQEEPMTPQLKPQETSEIMYEKVMSDKLEL